jgi:hypothetical protein
MLDGSLLLNQINYMIAPFTNDTHFKITKCFFSNIIFVPKPVTINQIKSFQNMSFIISIKSLVLHQFYSAIGKLRVQNITHLLRISTEGNHLPKLRDIHYGSTHFPQVKFIDSD